MDEIRCACERYDIRRWARLRLATLLDMIDFCRAVVRRRLVWYGYKHTALTRNVV